MKQRSIALLATLAIALGACSSSSTNTASSPEGTNEASTSDSSTAPAATSAATTSTTLAPTTSTTLAPTTTTEALPVLDPVAKVTSVLEAKSLFQITTESPELSADDSLIEAMVDDALTAVVDGSTVPTDYFDRVPASPGVVQINYLVCSLEMYYDPACEASAQDYAEAMLECESLETSSLFESIVEDGDRWAAAGVCVWRPSGEEVSEIVAYATLELAKAAQQITGSGTADPEIALIAQERADYFGPNPEGPEGEPFPPERIAMDDKIGARARGGDAYCGMIPIDEPNYQNVFERRKTFTEELKLGAPVASLGAAAVVMNNRIEVHMCWFTE